MADRPTNRPNDGRTDRVMGKLHFNYAEKKKLKGASMTEFSQQFFSFDFCYENPEEIKGKWELGKI